MKSLLAKLRFKSSSAELRAVHEPERSIAHSQPGLRWLNFEGSVDPASRGNPAAGSWVGIGA
jgi:hypothetical protein